MFFNSQYSPVQRPCSGLFCLMKDTFYFSHDYNARQDVKIKKLIFKHGMCGYGVFWAIVEDLYNNANALPLDYESIAYELRIDEEVVKSVINDFDLFVVDGLEFGSKSIENRLNERNEKSKKARKSALARWNKPKDDANALQTQSDGNAIKERKGKETKEKKTDNNDSFIKKSFKLWTKQDFLNSISELKESYTKDMLNEFYIYWTEKSASGKMKFQLQKTWETNLRLITWNKNQEKFNKSTPQDNPNRGGSPNKKAL